MTNDLKLFKKLKIQAWSQSLQVKIALNIDLTKWDDEQYNCFKVFDSCIEYKMQEKNSKFYIL